MGDSFKKLLKEYGPYVRELQQRLIFLVLSFGALFCFGFVYAPSFIRQFTHIFSVDSMSYVVSSPFQGVSLSIDVGLSFALMLFLPLLLSQVYGFTAPALTRKEKQLTLGYAAASLSFFAVGFAYGFAIMYYTLLMVTKFNVSLGLENFWDVRVFFSQVVLTSVMLGILFQFPVILYAGMRLGFLTPAFLSQQRRIVVAGSVVIVALLPPTDGLSLLIMAVPLVGLFELALLFFKLKEGKRKARLRFSNNN